MNDKSINHRLPLTITKKLINTNAYFLYSKIVEINQDHRFLFRNDTVSLHALLRRRITIAPIRDGIIIVIRTMIKLKLRPNICNTRINGSNRVRNVFSLGHFGFNIPHKKYWTIWYDENNI